MATKPMYWRNIVAALQVSIVESATPARRQAQVALRPRLPAQPKTASLHTTPLATRKAHPRQGRARQHGPSFPKDPTAAAGAAPTAQARPGRPHPGLPLAYGMGPQPGNDRVRARTGRARPAPGLVEGDEDELAAAGGPLGDCRDLRRGRAGSQRRARAHGRVRTH